MDLSDSENFLRKIYYAYIREPLMKIKERWLAYFAEFMIDEGPSTSDAESEIHSSMEVIPKSVLRSSGGTCEKSEQHLSRFSFITTVLGNVFSLSYLWFLPERISASHSFGMHFLMCISIIMTFGYLLFFVHLSLGQYTSGTAITFFQKIPLVQGVGYTMFIFTYIFMYQFGEKLTHASFLYSASFSSIVPWSRCSEGEYPELNITKCTTSSDMVDMQCPKRTITFNATKYCADKSYQSSIEDKCCHETSHCAINTYDVCHAWTFPTNYYAYTKYNRIDEKGNYKYLGPPELKFLIYFGAVWFLTFIFSSIDQKWSRLVMMIVHPCIIICLLILLPLSLGLDGAEVGLEELFNWEFEFLLYPDNWGRAVNDSLVALGLPTIMIFFFGSLSRFRSPCHLDTILIIFTSLVITILSSVVNICAYGYIKKKTPSLLFFKSHQDTSYIFEILMNYPIPRLSTIVYFSLAITAGVVTLSGFVVAMSATISDATHIYLKDRRIVSFLLTFSLFLLSVPYIYRNSNVIQITLFFMIQRMNSSWVCVIQLLALNIYGVGLFCEDISFMLGFYPNRIFRYIFIISPFVLGPLSVYWCLKFIVWNVIKNWVVLYIAAPIFLFAPTALGIIFAILVYSFKLDLLGIVRVSPSLGPKNEELKIQREEYRTKRRIF